MDRNNIVCMSLELRSRPFEPGTLGWTADDLDDPDIERQWEAGAYEIVDGVLTTMPAAYFPSGAGLFELMVILRQHFKEKQIAGKFSMEVDLILRKDRVARADAVFLKSDDQRLQRAAARKAGRPDPERTRILVPPTLIIESISPGHEAHDASTKRRWYAEAGVPHYWILNAFEKTLECLVLEEGAYRVDAAGRGQAKILPRAFPGLIIKLAELWS